MVIAVPPKKHAPSLDDMPIGGGKPPALNPYDLDEDKPVPKGAYNLDNLPADAFGDGGGALINDTSAKP